MALSGLENPAFKLENDIQEDKDRQRRIRVEGKKDEDEDNTLEDCNCFGNSLTFLNRFRNPKWCLVFLSIGALIQGMVISGLVNVVLTSIERRFGLQSTQSGFIVSSYDLGTILVAIPVTYLGGKVGASKPRWIAAGLLVMGLGSAVWSLPHFITDAYDFKDRVDGVETEEALCIEGTGAKEATCDTQTTGLSGYRYLFIFGQLLHGAGAMPLTILGTTLLNESVPHNVAPVYMAIFQTWFVIGPALGFILGGALLEVFVDSVPDLDITPASVLWVGAWWPGFLFAAVLAIFLAVPMSCFPAVLNIDTAGSLRNEEKNKEAMTLKELPSHLWALLTNSIYVFISLGGGIDWITLFGLAAFLPKYMEHQYGMTSGSAAQLVGMLVVPAGGGGTFFGGWIIKKLNLRRTSIILMCALSQVMGIFCSLVFLLSCSSSQYSGINYFPASPSSGLLPPPVPLAGISSVKPLENLLNDCNTDCRCPINKFSPVCGSDNIMYLSPCLAGCQTAYGGNYTGCSCVGEGETVSKIRCVTDCAASYIVPFCVFMFLLIFLTFFGTMPLVVVSLRSVDKEDQSLALGLQSIVVKLIGSIPGPIIFGYFTDQVCLLWEPDCVDSGSCLLYDNGKMSSSFLGICVVVKMISVIFYLMSAWASKRRGHDGQEEGDSDRRED